MTNIIGNLVNNGSIFRKPGKIGFKCQDGGLPLRELEFDIKKFPQQIGTVLRRNFGKDQCNRCDIRLFPVLLEQNTYPFDFFGNLSMIAI
ncbi:MAG: hypothetical protein LBI05_03940 [Planctomycetaceae bacterium]|nr:hypothetical protein [Planctomycetaceae bacterium]